MNQRSKLFPKDPLRLTQERAMKTPDPVIQKLVPDALWERIEPLLPRGHPILGVSAESASMMAGRWRAGFRRL
jgi:hypothetical protein